MEWFNISLSDCVSVGMMTIVYDLSPEQFDINSPVLRRLLGKETADYLTQFRAELINEFDRLDKPAEFSVDVQYKLALVKKPGKADIVLTSGEGGEATRIIEVPKDPSRSHPLRRKEVVEEVNDCLKDWGTINGYDIQCINTVYNIRKRPEFFYKGKVKGSPPQYSSAFVDWIIAQHKKNKSFFFQARIKSKQKMIHKNKKEPSVQQRDGLQRA